MAEEHKTDDHRADVRMVGEPGIAVLLSLGRHPVSGRSRIPPADAAALELALRLTPTPVAIHVGSANDAALRDYLGMGISCLTVLEGAGEGDDILPVLRNALLTLNPRLVLTGERAEAGEASGMLPYLLARALGRPLLPQCVGLSLEASRIVAVRKMAGGRRHRIAAEGVAVATVPAEGVHARYPAFGQARRGRIEITPIRATPDETRQGWTLAPARPRPPRLRPGGAASQATGPGAPLIGLSPEAAAEEIYRYLTAHGILRP